VDDQVEAPAEAVEEQQETAVNMPAQSFKKSVRQQTLIIRRQP
jgi:hypothetical protein